MARRQRNRQQTPVRLRALAREALVAGAFASVLSALALGWAGHHEVNSTTAPLNAVSHWRWGKPALRKRGLTGRYTALGYGIHHCASIWWASLYALATRNRRDVDRPATVLAGALATSAVACVVDFKCTPERLKPGFEQHLSRPALTGVYLAFAVGLALGAMASRGGSARRR